MPLASPYIWWNSWGMVAVVLAHVWAGYVLLRAETTTKASFPVDREPILVQVIRDAPQRPEAPPLAPKLPRDVQVTRKKTSAPPPPPKPEANPRESPPEIQPAVESVTTPETLIETPATDTPPSTPQLQNPAPPAPAPKMVGTVRYLREPQVQYPALSKRMNESGDVVVRVLIDIQGRAQDVSVSKSSGFERLDQAALRAVRDARFQAATENGVAVPSYALVPISFTLQE